MQADQEHAHSKAEHAYRFEAAAAVAAEMLEGEERPRGRADK